jgi:5,10-methylenetetrahydrofolate reductase
VLVGGSSPSAAYPGPTVLEANAAARSLGFTEVGNIAIPEREGEAERAIEKTKAGCTFFTTQVVFDAEKTCGFLEGYAKKCRETGLRPCTVFLSFAPASGAFDISFLRWLGASIPRPVEERLQEMPRTGDESVKVAREVLSEILEHASRHAQTVPLALNVEPVSMRNMPYAKRMISELGGKIRPI